MANQNRVKFGTGAITSGNTTQAITFPDQFPPNQTYVVIISLEAQDSVWVSGKSRTGFTANMGAINVYDVDFNWKAYMAQ